MALCPDASRREAGLKGGGRRLRSRIRAQDHGIDRLLLANLVDATTHPASVVIWQWQGIAPFTSRMVASAARA